MYCTQKMIERIWSEHTISIPDVDSLKHTFLKFKGNWFRVPHFYNNSGEEVAKFDIILTINETN